MLAIVKPLNVSVALEPKLKAQAALFIVIVPPVGAKVLFAAIVKVPFR